MKIILSEETSKLIEKKKEIEKTLSVKIKIKDKEISVEGSPEDEYIAEKVIDALGFGFPLSVALSIKREDFLFEILNVKDYTPRKDLKTIRARIIGKGGKSLRTLSELTDCHFELKNNDVGIIGSPECIKTAQDAIVMVIHGSNLKNNFKYQKKFG
jgi:KH domain-containing protein